MRRAFLSFALAALVMTRLIAAADMDVRIESRTVQPGEVLRLTLTTAPVTTGVEVRALGETWPVYRVNDTTWRALVGIDLDTAPQRYRIEVNAKGLPAPVIRQILVRPKPFPTRRLTVDEAFVNPPADVQARIAREAAELSGLWKTSAANRLWDGAFVAPVPQAANSAFGSRSILNGSPRSPHGGADFASPTGTPIHSPNAGRVVLAKPLYYTGNTVVVDHGLGVVSLFAHLSEIQVTTGDTVSRGQELGLVGMTGRVTGPHLHWAVRAGGARVDPLSLIAITAD